MSMGGLAWVICIIKRQVLKLFSLQNDNLLSIIIQSLVFNDDVQHESADFQNKSRNSKNPSVGSVEHELNYAQEIEIIKKQQIMRVIVKYSDVYRSLYDLDPLLTQYRDSKRTTGRQQVLKTLNTMVIAHYCSTVVLLSIVSSQCYFLLLLCQERNYDYETLKQTFEELIELSFLRTSKESNMPSGIALVVDPLCEEILQDIDHMETMLSTAKLRNIITSIITPALNSLWNPQGEDVAEIITYHVGLILPTSNENVEPQNPHDEKLFIVREAIELFVSNQGLNHAHRVSSQLIDQGYNSWIDKLQEHNSKKVIGPTEFSLMKITGRITTCTEKLLNTTDLATHPLMHCY